MFEKGKPIYITQGMKDVDKYLINVMLQQIYALPEPKDYLQVFQFRVLESGIQVVEHTTEEPKYNGVYYLPDIPKEALYKGKIYVIDDGHHITILKPYEW